MVTLTIHPWSPLPLESSSERSNPHNQTGHSHVTFSVPRPPGSVTATSKCDTRHKHACRFLISPAGSPFLVSPFSNKGLPHFFPAHAVRHAAVVSRSPLPSSIPGATPRTLRPSPAPCSPDSPHRNVLRSKDHCHAGRFFRSPRPSSPSPLQDLPQIANQSTTSGWNPRSDSRAAHTYVHSDASPPSCPLISLTTPHQHFS